LSRQAPLSRRALFGYALASAPVIYAYVLVLVMYMKYAVDDLGASPAAVGSIFLVAKLWDAISDPMVGNLSDRTERPSGRRRPWLKASAPLLALFGVMAWAPPGMLEGAGLIAWISLSILGFYTAYTIFDVPHMALGAELSSDPAERNRIFGVRQVLRIVGMLLAATLGVYWVGQGVREATAMAYGLGAVTLVLIFSGVSLLPPERAEFKGRGGQNPFRAIRDVLANRHARLLLFVLFVESIGAGGIGVLTPFLIEYVVKEKELVPVLLGVYMLASLAGVPLWIWVARSFEKRRLLLAAMLASSVGYGLVLFAGEGDWLIVGISGAIAGAAGACVNTLGYTLKSEIIDYDEHATGERKEGSYFAAWGFMGKLAAGIMIGLVGWTLEWSEFVPNEPEQTVLVKNTMRAMMGGLPLVCFGLGALVFSRFDLSEADSARIRAELDARDSKGMAEAAG
jgi:GPH family glycoside/pentoside/hexuronide:cation symporter